MNTFFHKNFLFIFFAQNTNLLILHYKQFNLPFQHPFTISKATKTHQSTLIVGLQLGNITGLGEATAISYYNITVEQMIEVIEQKRKMIEKFAFTTPDRYWHYLHHLLPNNPFLVCALDMAGWDLYGKLIKKPLHEIWQTNFDHAVNTDYTIGLDEIDSMVAKMKAKPWPVYKIKLGNQNDIEIIEALRKHTNSPFRVDVNGGWTLNQAQEKIKYLQHLNVELIEQPLPKENWAEMKILTANSPIPIFADESCVAENDVEKCAGFFHGINIKLTKCSGITPALRMIKKARELNLKVMMGSMNESTVGAAAVAHCIPQLDYVDVDGPLLLAQDTATGLHYDNGKVIVAKQAGLGVMLK